MIWESWSDFFSMGGYGVYVWGSYFVTIICIVGEIFLISRRRRTLHKHLGLIHESTAQEINNETTS
ncbi:MAG: heme exporter protein CcmD [Nitrosomonas sp.]|jgi:heme exporter protein D|nr:heme exporter protein CcmD [Nitrosomonas sp.]